MSGTIAYDLPVKDLIAGLNATGHVTHTAYRKDMVTLHHNGGRLSHEGVLRVWQTRPASAQFDVDEFGDVAQYVKANEYAWACGNTSGNQRSISIEMANSAIGGEWPVGESTWRSAARLTGWLCARVIGVRPSRSNVVPHHFWKATTCAGPYIDRVFGTIVDLAGQHFDQFVGQTAPSPTPPGMKSVDQIADEVIAGQWGNNPQRAQRLRAAGYDATVVQARVNEKLQGGGHSGPTLLPLDAIAREVIQGKWGNNPERARRLAAAGYNAATVQQRVNQLLR